MRVIARSTLNAFVRNRVEPQLQRIVSSRLNAWHMEASNANWSSSAEVKAQYTTASVVSSERVVFNIKGNEYRLVTAIDYESKILLIIWLGTHREYDRIDVKKVEYDRKRYADSSRPH